MRRTTPSASTTAPKNNGVHGLRPSLPGLTDGSHIEQRSCDRGFGDQDSRRHCDEPTNCSRAEPERLVDHAELDHTRSSCPWPGVINAPGMNNSTTTTSPWRLSYCPRVSTQLARESCVSVQLRVPLGGAAVHDWTLAQLNAHRSGSRKDLALPAQGDRAESREPRT